MRKSWLIVLFWLVSFPALGAPAVVQSAVGACHPSVNACGPSLTVTLASPVTSGDILVIAGMHGDGTTPSGVTIFDNSSDTVNLSIQPFSIPNNTGWMSQHYILAPTATTTTITASFNTTPSYADVCVWEVSGVNTKDVTSFSTGTGVLASTTSGTLSNSNEIALAYTATDTNTTSAGSGWTHDQFSDLGSECEHLIQTGSTSAITATANMQDSTTNWGIEQTMFFQNTGGSAAAGRRTLLGVGQ